MMSLPHHPELESPGQLLHGKRTPRWMGQVSARSPFTVANLEETLEPDFPPAPTETVQIPSYTGPILLSVLTFFFLLFLLWGRRFRDVRVGVLSTALVWLCLVVWLVVDAVTTQLLKTAAPVLSENSPSLTQSAPSPPPPSPEPEPALTPETTLRIAQGLGLRLPYINLPADWRSFFDLDDPEQLEEEAGDVALAGSGPLELGSSGAVSSGFNAADRGAAGTNMGEVNSGGRRGNSPTGSGGSSTIAFPNPSRPTRMTREIPTVTVSQPNERPTAIAPPNVPDPTLSSVTAHPPSQHLAETRSRPPTSATNSSNPTPSNPTPSNRVNTNPPPSPTTPRLPLHQGIRSFNVLELQRLLRALGFYQGEPDGHFGLQTVQAVQAFQREENLLVDGIVGFSTCTLLNAQDSEITLDCRP